MVELYHNKSTREKEDARASRSLENKLLFHYQTGRYVDLDNRFHLALIFFVKNKISFSNEIDVTIVTYNVMYFPY